MPTETIHRPTVAPGINPGGFWVRLCTDTELLAEHALDSVPAAGHYGEQDGETSNQALARGADVRCYIYDGDSGECIGTVIAVARKDG